MGPNVTAPVSQSGEVGFTVSTADNEHYEAVTRWLVAFLTKRGTRKLVRSYGTDFLKLARGGAIQDNVSLQRIFGSESKKAVTDAETKRSINVTSVILRKYSVVEDNLTLLLDFNFSDGTTGVKYIKVG